MLLRTARAIWRSEQRISPSAGCAGNLNSTRQRSRSTSTVARRTGSKSSAESCSSCLKTKQWLSLLMSWNTSSPTRTSYPSRGSRMSWVKPWLFTSVAPSIVILLVVCMFGPCAFSTTSGANTTAVLTTTSAMLAQPRSSYHSHALALGQSASWP
ncbi:MAG: hypothetical protein ACD_76C00105G0019 [uncultured bacterium]|nr:MAG: hypothetical protein ACD_76C00105G0019 [uncultured bacterium]